MILQFVGIPLRWEYRGYMYTMWFLDMSLRWVYPSLFKYFVVFALRCWTMSSMTLSVVYSMYFSFRTAVLDYVLLRHCQLCILCIFGHSLNMGLSFIVYGLK